MKRLLIYDSLIAVNALLLWVVLVWAEVKIQELWFFKYVFWSSLIFLFAAFPIASLVALKDKPRHLRFVAAAVSFFGLAPAFIFVGVMLVWYFKMAIGGGIA